MPKQAQELEKYVSGCHIKVIAETENLILFKSIGRKTGRVKFHILISSGIFMDYFHKVHQRRDCKLEDLVFFSTIFVETLKSHHIMMGQRESSIILDLTPMRVTEDLQTPSEKLLEDLLMTQAKAEAEADHFLQRMKKLVEVE